MISKFCERKHRTAKVIRHILSAKADIISSSLNSTPRLHFSSYGYTKKCRKILIYTPSKFWCRASEYPASAFSSSVNRMWVRPGAYARLFACILRFRCFFRHVTAV